MKNGRKRIHQKKLSITADDYGPHPFINRGILAAVRQSRITSVGVLTNNYAAENMEHYSYNLRQEILDLISAINDPNRKGKSNIGIGVHLTLTSGSPLTTDPALIHYKTINRFQDIREFKFGVSEDHLAAVGAEIEAQLRALKSILDEYHLPLDHISCHQGLIYLFSPYNEELIKAINRVYPNDLYQPNQKPVLRTTYPIGKLKEYKKIFFSDMLKEGKKRAFRMIDDNHGNLLKILHSTTLKQMQEAAQRYCQSGFLSTHYFFDNYYKKPTYNQINAVMRKFPHPYEISRGEFVVHLGAEDGYYEQVDLHGINRSYFPYRKKELNTLLETEIRRLAHVNGVTLVEMFGMH